LLAEPEVVDLTAAVCLCRQSSMACVPDLNLGQVEVALQYGINVCIKDARVVAIREKCFLILHHQKQQQVLQVPSLLQSETV
jgi:hypothetical protein